MQKTVHFVMLEASLRSLKKKYRLQNINIVGEPICDVLCRLKEKGFKMINLVCSEHKVFKNIFY